MKLNSKIIKQAIVDAIKSGDESIIEYRDYEEDRKMIATEMKKYTSLNDWKRSEKEKNNDCITRHFICPDSDMLSATVTTDVTDENILKIEINAD